MELLLASYVLLVLGTFSLGGGLAAPEGRSGAASRPLFGQPAQPADHRPDTIDEATEDPAPQGAFTASSTADPCDALDAEAERALAHFLTADLDWPLSPAPPVAVTAEIQPLLIQGFSPDCDALELTYRPETDGSGQPVAPMIELLDNDSACGLLIRFNGRPLADLPGVTDLPSETLHLVALA